jgi:hypothetical protein
VGFATGAFTGGAYMHPRFGFAQGFDVYGYWPDRARDEKEIATGVDRALAWMGTHLDEPCLFFLHTYEVHDPYRARQPHFAQLAPEIEAPPGARIALVSPQNEAVSGFRQSNSFVLRTQGPGGGQRPVKEEELPLVSAMYDSGISHMDAELGRLFDGIEGLGLAGRLLVVITADHGEALGEHGLAGHIYPYDCNLLIPLVVSAPDGTGAGRLIKDQVQLVDLLPTVLDAVDCDPPEDFDGVSLRPYMEDQPQAASRTAFSYASASGRGLAIRIENRLKYVLDNTAWGRFAGREELYDLVADPYEVRNLADEDGRVQQFRSIARAYLAEYASGLRFEVRNPGTGTVRGKIRGHLVRPVATKSIDLSAPHVSWVEMGQASFEAPPGASYTLLFEKVFGSELQLEGELDISGDRHPFQKVFHLDQLDPRETLLFDGISWRSERDSLTVGATGFSVSWHGGTAVLDGAPAPGREEVREQLRALGYVQ